jgi:alpha-galactosidase
MLEVGNGGMDRDEYRTHMALWAILAAPLLAGNDLRNMSQETKDMLTNADVLAVDQDPKGVQGHRVWQEGPLEIWTKPLVGGSLAVGLFNRTEAALKMTVDFRSIGAPATAKVRDLWGRKDLGTLENSYSSVVPKHGVVFLKISK